MMLGMNCRAFPFRAQLDKYTIPSVQLRFGSYLLVSLAGWCITMNIYVCLFSDYALHRQGDSQTNPSDTVYERISRLRTPKYRKFLFSYILQTALNFVGKSSASVTPVAGGQLAVSDIML